MTTTGTPQTFYELYVSALQRVRTATNDGTSVQIMKSYINQANEDLAVQQNWSWAERQGYITTHAPYTSGNVSISASARTTLTGNGTAWNTAVGGMGFNNMRADGKLVLSGANDVYRVASVSSDTAATLTSRYVESIDTASAYALAYGTYTYFEDEYALASDFFRLVDTRTFSPAMKIEVLGRQEFYRLYPRNSGTSPGTPRACTIVELGPSGAVDPRPRVVFAPPPDGVLSIPYRYITTNLAVSSAGAAQINMSATDDEPIIPLRYRHVLIFYAIAQWYRDRKDDQRAQQANGEYVDLVKRIANDSEPQRDRPRFVPPNRMYRSGTAGPRRMGRGGFSTGTWFDEMRD